MPRNNAKKLQTITKKATRKTIIKQINEQIIKTTIVIIIIIINKNNNEKKKIIV